MARPARPLAVACVLLLVAGQAAAHDTWLTSQPVPSHGLVSLALVTGDRFPLPQSAPQRDGIAAGGCFDTDARVLPLVARQNTPQGLLLRVRTGQAAHAPWACWTLTRAVRVMLEPQLADAYLRDIQAPPEVRQRWDQQKQAGHAWRERYTKQARIEHTPAGGRHEAISALRTTSGRGLEIVPLGTRAVRVGEPLTVQVLHEGKPLAAQSVQLLSERSILGIWRRTDAQGHAVFDLPFTGRWLLRAVRLVPPAAPEGEWQGSFGTLALEPAS